MNDQQPAPPTPTNLPRSLRDCLIAAAALAQGRARRTLSDLACESVEQPPLREPAVALSDQPSEPDSLVALLMEARMRADIVTDRQLRRLICERLRDLGRYAESSAYLDTIPPRDVCQVPTGQHPIVEYTD